jgi:putative membrane protein
MEIISQVPGIVKFLVYFLSAVSLTALFLVIYIRVTPYKEFDLINKGNAAAACSLSGALLGFIIPLASAIIHSVNYLDMVLWGAVALIVQILVFFIVRFLLKQLTDAIQEGVMAKGLFLGALSLAAGILNAACMSY